MALRRMIDWSSVLNGWVLSSRCANLKPFTVGSMTNPNDSGSGAMRVVERTLGDDRSEITNSSDVVAVFITDVDPISTTKAFDALDVHSARPALRFMFESGVWYAALSVLGRVGVMSSLAFRDTGHVMLDRLDLLSDELRESCRRRSIRRMNDGYLLLRRRFVRRRRWLCGVRY